MKHINLDDEIIEILILFIEKKNENVKLNPINLALTKKTFKDGPTGTYIFPNWIHWGWGWGSSRNK